MKENKFVYNKNNIRFARENRKNSTKSESLIRNYFLKNKKMGYKFLRQKLIGNYIMDFYCSNLKLCLEIDGESHNYEHNADKERQLYIESLGIKVIRYSDHEVLNNLDSVGIDIESQIYEREKDLKTLSHFVGPSPLQGDDVI